MSFLQSREGRRAEARTSPQARHYMQDVHGGWRIVSGKDGGWADRCGLTAHRGIVHPDEYVNVAVLRSEVERWLGFTLAELREAYGMGRKSPARAAARARVDARLLMLARGGGNMALLARIVGIHDHTFQRALARARQAPLLVFCAWHEKVPPDATGTICPECAATYAF